MVKCTPATPAIKKGDKVTITRVNQALVPTTNAAPTPSPDGTKAVSVVYGGATWTFGANKETLRNGVHVANGLRRYLQSSVRRVMVQALASGGAPGACISGTDLGGLARQSNERLVRLRHIHTNANINSDADARSISWRCQAKWSAAALAMKSGRADASRSTSRRIASGSSVTTRC
jgi:hypothetical protein